MRKFRLINKIISFFTGKVKHPEKWNINRRCTQCDWHSSPNDEIRVIDVMFLSKSCPVCHRMTKFVKYLTCPVCGTEIHALPKTLRQILWGGRTCKRCKTELDKWGRIINRDV